MRQIAADAFHDRIGNAQQVFETTGFRIVIYHHVELRGQNEHTDTSQHAVDDGRGNGSKHLSQPQQSEGDLKDPMRTAIIASASIPRPLTISRTMTASPADGPLIWIGLPASAPITIPPTIAVTSPLTGGTPDAIAIPIDNGTLINTTTSAGIMLALQPVGASTMYFSMNRIVIARKITAFVPVCRDRTCRADVRHRDSSGIRDTNN